MARSSRRALGVAGAALLAVTAVWVWAAHRASDDRLPPGDYRPRADAHWTVPEARAQAIRDDALARARVWRVPPEPIESVDFRRNPGDDDPLPAAPSLSCKFQPRPTTGTTPKFDCILPGGDLVKVKYGHNPELHAEVAASRLLAALGFGADRMYFVPRVRCFGCPFSPFRTYQALELTGAHEAYTRRIDFDDYTDFEWPAVERRFRGSSIDAPEVKGWSFHELDRIDPARGGASRAEVDALRLMAVVLSHWDNKAENQRLVCLAEPHGEENGECPAPFALIQDLGSSFGPKKMNLAHWSRRRVWTDPATCEVDLKDMPFNGATFGSARISESGRRFLADKLTRLSEAQLRTLFLAARFPEFHGDGSAGGDVSKWVEALRGKIREIAERAPCPS
jgi:hypothetical protein